MAGAMARGWAAGSGGPEAMLFRDVDAGRAGALAEQVGGDTRASLRELADESDVVLLAVKPAALETVAEELEGTAPALLSIIAVTPIARIDTASLCPPSSSDRNAAAKESTLWSEPNPRRRSGGRQVRTCAGGSRSARSRSASPTRSA